MTARFEHQEVALMAITTPIIPLYDDITNTTRKMEPDEFVAFCARVSNPANQNNIQTAGKLIKYLIKNEHWSPFEQVSLTMEIRTTRDIGRQILRHRSFSFQEFSQRYAAAQNFTKREARLQDTKNRQNSIDTDDNDTTKLWNFQLNKVLDAAQTAYEWALNNGVAKEQARVVLPEGMTMSTMFMAGTLRSFYHYVSVRNHPATQKEHQDIAKKMTNILIKEFPSIAPALHDQISYNFSAESNH